MSMTVPCPSHKKKQHKTLTFCNADYDTANAHAGGSVVALPVYLYIWGWSGDVIMLGKLPVLGRPTNLDNGRAGAYCTCSRCESFFPSHLSFLTSFSLSLGDDPI